MTQNLQNLEQIENIKSVLDRPVILMGMMGVGKSRIGRKLAKALNVIFYDSDHLIEEKAGCSINEIFERFGEDKFRDSEHRTITELLTKGACIIAVGGGAPVNNETLRAIKEKSISIWLTTDIEKILTRLKGNQTRPLLKDKNHEQILKKLMNDRAAFYAQADIKQETGSLSVKKIISELIKALSENLNTVTF